MQLEQDADHEISISNLVHKSKRPINPDLLRERAKAMNTRKLSRTMSFFAKQYRYHDDSAIPLAQRIFMFSAFLEVFDCFLRPEMVSTFHLLTGVVCAGRLAFSRHTIFGWCAFVECGSSCAIMCATASRRRFNSDRKTCRVSRNVVLFCHMHSFLFCRAINRSYCCIFCT